ncbi:hypothetical protein G4G27_13680 [Sphingomonas sp. So64.6b]|uniref:hypothetical protein n=1 Tax=Sphingomonas sp. So64.6b TaxID=2997354 RepID=UPI00160267E1|nr:hypothetical protein [Sphingomonas sp. So64.6b]QNA84929.1 hypothetical protein G4G27_13680 [Sphingomonas sp. So64.6b]
MALLTGLMLHSAPARAADSDHVLLKAKIVAILGYHADDRADDAILLSHSIETLVALEVEEVLWGKFTPKKTTAIMVMAGHPLKPHVGRSVYLMGDNYNVEDEPLHGGSNWTFTDKAICFSRLDVRNYKMSKKGMKRLTIAGVIVLTDANDYCP